MTVNDMNEWQGKLTKEQAIILLERITDNESPYWDQIVDDYYDEETDTMPSIYHLYIALGITKQEYIDAIGYTDRDRCNPNWPRTGE